MVMPMKSEERIDLSMADSEFDGHRVTERTHGGSIIPPMITMQGTSNAYDSPEYRNHIPPRPDPCTSAPSEPAPHLPIVCPSARV